ncbi:hypothetical protein DFP73DRAFT_469654 [Morchella snyderi]|nr:hypothetical protein DFP73DRAFT_469654 [Morchella snyderi]
MTSLSFLLPFAHWPPSTPLLPPASTVTAAKFLPEPDPSSHAHAHAHDLLVLGLSTGELLLLHLSSDPEPDPDPHARLTGHHSPILALASLPTHTDRGPSHHLLSLDASSHLRKWSPHTGRCLLSASASPALRSAPRGLRVAVSTTNPDTAVVIVYGCSTEMAVLHAETLAPVLVWAGSVDWPLPAVARNGRNVLAWMPGGRVHGWVLQHQQQQQRRVGAAGAAGTGTGTAVGVERDHAREFSGAGGRGEWGAVVGFERAAETDHVLVQRGGVTVYSAAAAEEGGPCSFVLRSAVGMAPGVEVAGYEVFEERGLLFVWAGNGNGCVIQRRRDDGRWALSGTFARPGSVAEGEKAVAMAFTERQEGAWVVAAASRSAPGRGGMRAQGGLAVGVLSLEDGSIKWSNDKEVLSTPPPPQPDDEAPLCTCSALFANMMVFAHGPVLHLHTLPSFLLSYATPTTQVAIPTSSRICLLKRVKIGEYIGAGRHGGVHGGKEYLVVGSAAGELFIVEPPALQSSRRLPLSATPIASAALLPTALGKRLRSTLFVAAADGTAAIVDVERARIMATFPSHDYLRLTAVATKPAQNVVLLTYEDGARREWDLGEEEGGVLKPPPPSSRGSDRSGGGGSGGVYPADLADEGWHDVKVGGAFAVEEVDEGEEENEGPIGDAAMKACLHFCEQGLPTMVVDVKSVLDTLKASVDVARQRSRRHERVVVGNNPALIAAKSLLTALIPGGIEVLLGWGKQDDYEWRTSVSGYFFKRKTPAVLGQIGGGKQISLLAPQALTRSEDTVWGIGHTVTSIVLLAALSLVGGLLEAGGKDEFFEAVIERTMENLLQGATWKPPALGVFAKYWMDRNLLVRKTARTLMQICMQRLTDEQRDDAVAYWSRFLPVLVPPELFSSKDVVRSAVILGKLTADYPDKVEVSVKKNVALSVELLLGDANPHFQDTAIELVGHGWSAFQSLFDPAEVIHILIRISSTHPDTFPETRRKTLHDCILSIARTNSPLLGSGLANNIAHGAPSPTQPPSTATTMSTAVTICVAAMRIAIVIIRADAILFHDILSLLVAAVVKILDPSSPLREKVLPTVTELVNELVDAYPGIAFHRATQRLALSVSPGAILVFDLKAATETNVLRGHSSMAVFLAYSVDGRHLAAVDLDEGGGGVVLVWRFVSGLLSFIGGSDGPPGVLMPRRREPLRNARRVGVVEVEWTGERSVKVTAGAEVTVLANVEGRNEGGGGGGGWGIL